MTDVIAAIPHKMVKIRAKTDVLYLAIAGTVCIAITGNKNKIPAIIGEIGRAHV